MSVKGTLFSFFQKTASSAPKKSVPEKKRSENVSSISDQIGERFGADSYVRPTANQDAKTETKTPSSSLSIVAGHLIWSQMEGHLWWPGVVWQHPRSKKITRGKGTRMECHLHFFGQPQTRGWVRLE